MRVLPAHLADAKEMAKALYPELTNCLFPVSGLQAAQELMATALGYNGWIELRKELVRAHEPVYLDRLPAEQARALEQGCVTRLAEALGTPSKGLVASVFEVSGVGCSPGERRQRGQNWSPWGLIREQKEVVPGILAVSSARHGGYRLSEARQAEMLASVGYTSEWHDEDDAAKIRAAFPNGFNLVQSERTIGSARPSSEDGCLRPTTSRDAPFIPATSAPPLSAAGVCTPLNAAMSQVLAAGHGCAIDYLGLADYNKPTMALKTAIWVGLREDGTDTGEITEWVTVLFLKNRDFYRFRGDSPRFGKHAGIELAEIDLLLTALDQPE